MENTRDENKTYKNDIESYIRGLIGRGDLKAQLDHPLVASPQYLAGAS